MRRGECQKLFGAVVFQVGHHPVQVTDWSDQKGAVLLFWKKGGTDGLSLAAALREGVSNWMTERVNEWMGDWVKGEQITCSLTDRGKPQRSALIPPRGPWASASGCSTGLQGTARCWIISLDDCISGQIFYLIWYKVLVFLTIPQYSSNLQWLLFSRISPGILANFKRF